MGLSNQRDYKDRLHFSNWFKKFYDEHVNHQSFQLFLDEKSHISPVNALRTLTAFCTHDGVELQIKSDSNPPAKQQDPYA